jgi:hypothetical protein
MRHGFQYGVPAEASIPALEVHNLNQTFERDSANEVRALIDVSLTLMPGTSSRWWA